ncbi:MAG: glycosyltransferase family 4 protein [Pseudomonadota bacterium]
MRILHILRAPVGGLFRHVRDLAEAQAARGHDVGVLCGGSASDSLTSARLAELEPHLSLGLHRVPMPRGLGIGDIAATRKTRELLTTLAIDISHGHGAKGGAYARLAVGGDVPARAYYTPHGGSLHYAPTQLQGRLFMALEQHLASKTSGIVFESAYSQRIYDAKVGKSLAPSRVVPNGLLQREFIDHKPDADAADFLFIGELRAIKGVDILLDSLQMVGARDDRAPPKCIIVGDGPDAEALRAKANSYNLGASVTFTGAQPAPRMFDRAKCLVMPSRAESFPYVILETAARGMPIITTDVGGISEITGPTGTRLIEPESAFELKDALVSFLNAQQDFDAAAVALKERTARLFSVDRMTDDVLDFYEADRQRAAA